jgi:hypothetical protein
MLPDRSDGLAEPVSIETSGNGWDEDEVARGVSGTEIFGSLALPCVKVDPRVWK